MINLTIICHIYAMLVQFPYRFGKEKIFYVMVYNIHNIHFTWVNPINIEHLLKYSRTFI